MRVTTWYAFFFKKKKELYDMPLKSFNIKYAVPCKPTTYFPHHTLPQFHVLFLINIYSLFFINKSTTLNLNSIMVYSGLGNRMIVLYQKKERNLSNRMVFYYPKKTTPGEQVIILHQRRRWLNYKKQKENKNLKSIPKTEEEIGYGKKTREIEASTSKEHGGKQNDYPRFHTMECLCPAYWSINGVASNKSTQASHNHFYAGLPREKRLPKP